MDKIKRNSNFELMRIISMLFIILWHCILFGNILNNCENQKVRLLFSFVEYIIVVHVNSYVLTTGYFQIDKKLKLSKVLQILNNAWFWKSLILIVFIIFNLIQPSKIDIFFNTFILDTGQYWFINIYVILYLISPFINILISKLDKKTYIKLLIVLTVILCLFPYLFMSNSFGFSNDGYTLYHFVYLYFIGGYIKKFPLRKEYIINKMTINQYRFVLIIVFLLSCSINFLIYNFFVNNMNVGELFDGFASHIIDVSRNYNNPFIIMQSISYFLFFETINFKNRFINKIAGLTTGIYLIHMNQYVKLFLYKWLKIDDISIVHIRFLIYVLFIVFLIFVICAILEWIRQKIFKFIYNRKLSCKWRNIYRNFIDSCGIRINW